MEVSWKRHVLSMADSSSEEEEDQKVEEKRNKKIKRIVHTTPSTMAQPCAVQGTWTRKQLDLIHADDELLEAPAGSEYYAQDPYIVQNRERKAREHQIATTALHTNLKVYKTINRKLNDCESLQKHTGLSVKEQEPDNLTTAVRQRLMNNAPADPVKKRKQMDMTAVFSGQDLPLSEAEQHTSRILAQGAQAENTRPQNATTNTKTMKPPAKVQVPATPQLAPETVTELPVKRLYEQITEHQQQKQENKSVSSMVRNRHANQTSSEIERNLSNALNDIVSYAKREHRTERNLDLTIRSCQAIMSRYNLPQDRGTGQDMIKTYRVHDELFLCEALAGEQACCNGLECEGHFIPNSPRPVTLKAYYAPEELTLETQRMSASTEAARAGRVCLMCYRVFIMAVLASLRGGFIKKNADISYCRYYNVVDSPGEYALDQCEMSSNEEYQNVPHPVVRHDRHWYRGVERNGRIFFVQEGYIRPVGDYAEFTHRTGFQ